MTTPPLPEQIELHRDRMWRRDEDLRIESAVDAERFIEDVGFANTLTDTRRAGPSLYIAVCGRRDVSLPRNVQKNEETRLTWYLPEARDLHAGIIEERVSSSVYIYAALPQHTAVSLRLTGSCFFLNLRLCRRTRRSLESSMNHPPERRSLSAMCGGKAAPRDSSGTTLGKNLAMRIGSFF